MNESARKVFLAEMNRKFISRLREVNYLGSKGTYRRGNNEVVHVLNIRGNSMGYKCYLDVGMHLTFLPDFLNRISNPKQIKITGCEFRLFNIFPKREPDGWYYLRGSVEVDDLADSYFSFCEPILRKYEGVTDFVNAFPLSAWDDKRLPDLPWTFGTHARAALTYARIHKYLGNIELTRQFAKLGIAHLTTESLLRLELEALAGGA
jgi:Domain of unknown function (DUF4304)